VLPSSAPVSVSSHHSTVKNAFNSKKLLCALTLSCLCNYDINNRKLHECFEVIHRSRVRSVDMQGAF